MIFPEKTEVIYEDMLAVVDFVCNSYIVLKVNAPSNLNNPRILVYSEDFPKIRVLKSSSK